MYGLKPKPKAKPKKNNKPSVYQRKVVRKQTRKR